MTATTLIGCWNRKCDVDNAAVQTRGAAKKQKPATAFGESASRDFNIRGGVICVNEILPSSQHSSSTPTLFHVKANDSALSSVIGRIRIRRWSVDVPVVY
jgi:hypothetical protein